MTWIAGGYVLALLALGFWFCYKMIELHVERQGLHLQYGPLVMYPRSREPIDRKGRGYCPNHTTNQRD